MANKTLTSIVTLNNDFSNFLSFMPNPNILLRNTGESLEVFEEMLIDSHTKTKKEHLFDEILSRDWHLESPDNSKKAQAITLTCEQMIRDNLNLQEDFEEILSGVTFGFSVSEIVWELKNGLYIPNKLEGRTQKRFKFKPDGTLLYLHQGQQNEIDETYKFIVFTHDGINGNRYGNSILTPCYWLWKFKNAGFKFWLMVLDRFGVPTILALFEKETNDENELQERANIIAGQLQNIQSNSTASVGNVKDIKTVSASGTSADFKILIDLCNAEISKAITGEILSSDTGDKGSYALGEVHENTKKSRAMRIARNLENTLNKTLIKWIVELNYGTSTPSPKMKFDFSEDASWEVIKNSIDRGIPVSKTALYQTYKIPQPADEDDVFLKPAGMYTQEQKSFSDFFFQKTTPGKSRLKLKP